MVVAGCQSTQKSFKEGWAASNLAQRSVQKRTEDRWLKVMRTVGVVRKNCPRRKRAKKITRYDFSVVLGTAYRNLRDYLVS